MHRRPMHLTARSTRQLANGALLLAGTLVSLAGAEVLVRLTNGARYADRPTFYPADPGLGWAPAPNLDDVYYGGDYSISVATDESGHRLGRLGAVPDSVERVLLVGDSYTFGWGVSTEETYASQLDELLDARALRAVNLGVGGYGTTQSAIRLERYLRAHPTAPVAAIVLLHSHNDPSDNVTFETVRRGLRVYVESSRTSGLHLHGLVRLAGRALDVRAASREATLPGGHRDFLWTVGPRLTEAGRAVTRLDDPPSGSDAEAMAPEQEVLATYERQSLTRLQTELLWESIAHIHRLAAERGAAVLHVAIHTAPEWYLEPIHGMVARSAEADGRVRWCGRVPVESGFSGPESNDHSGSHFTPELNGYYARTIAGWLANGCEDPGRREAPGPRRTRR